MLFLYRRVGYAIVSGHLEDICCEGVVGYYNGLSKIDLGHGEQNIIHRPSVSLSQEKKAHRHRTAGRETTKRTRRAAGEAIEGHLGLRFAWA